MTRQTLLSNLLSCVQQCQVRYGGKSELATENEEVVSKLCRSLELALSHGLKLQSRTGFALKQVTELVSNNFGGFLMNAGGATTSETSSSPTPVMWSFIKAHLNRHELERYMLLKSVNTDAGRGRAWLRASLNEHSLERYVHLFIGDQELLSQHYERAAFLRDQERSSMLPSMAAGLGSILFAITIDNGILNQSTDPFTKSSSDELAILASVRRHTPTTTRETKSESDAKSVAVKKKKKVRKVSPKIVEFDEKDVGMMKEQRAASVSSDSRSESSLGTTSSGHQQEATTSPSSSLSYEPIHLAESTTKNAQNISDRGGSKSINNNPESDDLDFYSQCSSSDAANQSTSEPQTPMQDPSALSKLTPIRNVEIGGLIPLSTNGEIQHDIQSEDSASVRSFGDESDYGSVFTDLPTTPGKPEHSSGKSVTGASRASSIGSAISREDLKQALLSVMSRKDELQTQCVSLKKLVDQEASVAASLQEELKEARRKSTESIDKLGIRIQTLTRENELLKHQLKKYVGAVQKLRDGPMAYETLAQLEGQSAAAAAEASSKYVDYHFEASEFERKLIQVAEMHGELLEFNEHLQKVLQGKDNYIRRLRDELVELRGPLPDGEGDQQDDTMSLASEAESTSTSIISISSQCRLSLINIWIPSVFLSGSGSKTHHVYQVYLKIGSEEWNIYRRYSEFYALHKDLQQRERAVASFDFPPKKTVGYKTDKVVEDRRKRLQAYLRCVVNLMVQMNPALLAKPDKEHVLILMPFFAETSALLGHSAASPSMLAQLNHHRLFQRNPGSGHPRGFSSEPAPQLAL